MEIKQAIEILQCIVELGQAERQDMRAEILAIQALQEKQQREETGDWISVEDRLPNDDKVFSNQEFIVFIKGAANPTTLYFNSELKEWWSDESGEYIFYRVTHWQPLPKLPKDKEEI